MSFNRRQFLSQASLACLFSSMGAQASQSKGQKHYASKAKQIIFLNMRGAPSHLDTFDYKPALVKANGKQGKYRRELLASPWKFKQSGKSGLWISSLFPHLAKQADELCLLRGMHTSQPNHPQAQTVLHTGNFQFARPSLGAWLMYGLGTINKDLPGFVSLGAAAGTSAHYGSAFLPSEFQGMAIGRLSRRSSVSKLTVPNIKNKNIDAKTQRKQVDFIQSLNDMRLEGQADEDLIHSVKDSYEMAYRMQSSMPKVLDWGLEKSSTRRAYGFEQTETASFASRCLSARRLIESGVRFVELTHGSWDHHSRMKIDTAARAKEIDQPIAALLADLKQRGLLESTLVIWAGEFGRTPESATGDGRDHNPKGFTTWMAGAGVKGGFSYGGTDELGYEAVEGRLSMHDYHATILRIMGLDHERLTYKYAGRDFRLTDVHGEVAKDILS